MEKNTHPRQKFRKASMAAAPAKPISHAAPSQLDQLSSSLWFRSRNKAPRPENIIPHIDANCFGGPGENCGFDSVNRSKTAITMLLFMARGESEGPLKKRRVKSANRPIITQCISAVPLNTAPSTESTVTCAPVKRIKRLSTVAGKLKRLLYTGPTMLSTPQGLQVFWPSSIEPTRRESSFPWVCSCLTSSHPPTNFPLM
mmetsp:Transcript_44577/g.83234  ORF Transcript_44577/g.83234 Transcript_44577/m.83234 type:complete len:200 (-) Transcript_44577:201-800(-)